MEKRASSGGAMSKQFSERFYKSTQWQTCREAYSGHVGHLCERCLERGIITPGVIIHHIIPLTPENINDPNITLNFDNLRCVCRKCHAIEHGAPEKRYEVDEFGRVVGID